MVLENPVKYLILLASSDDKKIDINKASELLKISASTVRKYLNLLVKEGFIEKREDGFYLTSLGEKFLKTIKSIKTDFQASSPYFITDLSTGVPIPLSFKNYKQLLCIIKNEFVDKNTLELHFKQYMINWIKNSLNDEFLLELTNRGLIKNIDDLKNYLENLISIENTMRERIT